MHRAGQELGQVVKDECRLVGDDGLGFVLSVSAPERKPDELVMFLGRKMRKAVEAVIDPLEVSARDVVIEVRIVVTSFLSLLCSEIAPLLQGPGEEDSGSFFT
jgi:hypothetical protein